MTSFVPGSETFCPRCKCIVRTPASLPLEMFAEVLALRRSDQTLQAVALLARSGCAGLGEAKTFVFHITAPPGQCHRCRKPLLTGVAECATCRSFNLDFAAPPNNALQRTGTGGGATSDLHA